MRDLDKLAFHLNEFRIKKTNRDYLNETEFGHKRILRVRAESIETLGACVPEVELIHG